MKPRPARFCRDCGSQLRTPTADRCRDCHLVWMHGPFPPEPDWVVVERLMAGIPTPATDLERAEAARRLTARGVGAPEIAARLGCSERTIVRWRARDRVPA